MATTTRYRYIKFYGGKILDAANLIDLQRQISGLNEAATAKTAYDLGAIFREGALYNATFTISGTNATIAPLNTSLPISVFVRGRWETILTGEISTVSLPTGGNLYLNWALRQVTSVEDPSLVDATTGQSTIDMGELDLSISATDTSATGLTSTQFEKNLAPIILATFAPSGSTLTVSYIDNVKSQSLANANTSGLVKLTTGTSSGVAVATDDSRMSNTRTPTPGSVIDVSVRTPSSTGATNADGSVQYSLSSDPGGISSSKIIYPNGLQTVTAALNWIKTQISSAITSLNNHIGLKLGLSNTHPMPNASDVGAAPTSHVNMPLGVSGSHPATVSANTGGFSVLRDASVGPNSNDPAFGVNSSGTNKASLNHNGDIWSSAANGWSASPGGSGITVSGALGFFSTVAAILSQHVNQTSHGNPHGLTAGDIGAASTGYVDSAVANILSQAETYANGILVQAETYANHLISVTNNGSQWSISLGNGSLVIKGGVTGDLNNSRQTISFPVRFPTACIQVVAGTSGATDRITYVTTWNANNFTVGNNGSQAGASWIAIGY